MNKIKQKAIIEAVLFSMGDSVKIDKISNLIEASREETCSLIFEMQQDMDKNNRGITLVILEDAVQMCTKQEMYEYLIDLTKNDYKFQLSDAALEALSIVAYKQPVTKLDVEKIRGVNSDHAINRLVEFNLIKELGRLDAPGKPILFGTTEQFLRSFGVKSLEDLPEVSAQLVEEFKEQAESEASLQLDI